MRYSIFIEHFGHFLGDHVTIVLNGDERDFFSYLGHRLWSGTFWALAGLFGVSFMDRVYTSRRG